MRQVYAQDLDTLLRALRGYQAFGARYALVQRRTILGDEMGLGKTIQAIAAMAHLAARRAARTSWWSARRASSTNWAREVAAALRPAGPGAARRRTGTQASRTWLADGGVGDRDLRGARAPCATAGMPRPALLVVDEAHYVKNPRAQRSAREPRRWARTGRARAVPVRHADGEQGRRVPAAWCGYLQPDVAESLDPSGGPGRRRGVPPVGRARLPAAQPGGRAHRAARAGAGRRVGAVRHRTTAPPTGGRCSTGNFMAMRRAAFASARRRRVREARAPARDRRRGDGQRPQGGRLLLLPRRPRAGAWPSSGRRSRSGP